MPVPLRRWWIVTLTVAVLAGCAGGTAGDDASPGADDRPVTDTEADGDATSGREDVPTGGADAEADDPGGVEEPVLSVVATVAPVADLVRTVGGDRVEVASLVPSGADSHTYEPRPQDVARLSRADAYLGIGLDLNAGAVRLAEANLPDGAPVVLLGEVALTRDEIIFDHSHGDDGHSHGDDGHSHGDDGHSHGDDGHSHGDDGHSHGDDGHSHGDDGEDVDDHGDSEEVELGPNAHVWTSLRNADSLTDAIAETLSELDPDGERHYRDNAAVAQEELRALDLSISDATATIPASNRTLVTYHDAWSYFARDYGLEFATAIQPADFAEPSAAEVGAVIDLIRERAVPAVFGSEVFPTPVLETIAAETGALYVGDLVDDVLPGDPGDPEHTYLDMMRRNAATIVSGLGGDASQLEG